MTIQTRNRFIERKTLDIFKNNKDISFPIDVISIIKSQSNCRVLSYLEFASKYNTSVEDVILMCDSASGCTHYDKNNDNYLILYNSCSECNNVSGRILWTLSHELGHVVLSHLPTVAYNMAAENGFSNLTSNTLEKEADIFAANLLAPLPLFEKYNIKSPLDIKRVFGLSNLASNNRMSDYIIWMQSHCKTAYENDLIRIFANK